MPDTGSSSAPAKSTGGTWFTRKIWILPAWGWGVVAVGGYYWYTHYGPGATKAAAQQQPAGGGLKTYAPKITETINQRGPTGPAGRKPPARKPPKRRHPPRSHPPAAAPTAAPAMATATPGGINPGGPDKRPGRRKRPPPPPPPQPGPPPATVPPGNEQVASADLSGPPTGGPVNADTGQPVYWEWQHAHRGPEVPMPVAAYAPMTNGAVYDAASTGATLAAG